MRKIGLVFLGVLLIACVGCNYEKAKQTEVSEEKHDEYVTKDLPDNEIAVGSLLHGGEKCYFVPEYINDRKVIQLGFQSGWVFPGYGTFIDPEEGRIDKLICPSTIVKLYANFLQWGGDDFVLTYCGKVQNLGILDKNSRVTYYVPSEQYEEYLEVFSYADKEKLKKANVVYDLNYDDRKYYYVDYVEPNKKIENIPPKPTRAGFVFDGWYLDKSYTKEFDFEKNEVSLSEEEIELRLYAKWNLKI